MPSEKARGGMEKRVKRKANVLGKNAGAANPYERIQRSVANGFEPVELLELL
jgi:hypothetical protein